LRHKLGIGMAGFSCRLLLATAAGLGSMIVAAAANPQGDSAISDRSNRELLVAHDAMRDQRIDTTDRGQVQLLFTDQSSLSIAPDSDVVINDFRFDPQTQIGSLTATVTTGLLRYVGGQISKKTDVAFYTPGATVSVRGGIVLIKTERDKHPDGGEKTEVFFLSGDRMCVSANGKSQCTTKFGTAIISRSGDPPSEPAPVTPEMIQALFRSLQAAAADEPAQAGAGSASETMAAARPPRRDRD
jgi:hypothetical protein